MVSESRRWCEFGTGVIEEWIWEMPRRKATSSQGRIPALKVRICWYLIEADFYL